ncbi:RAS guanyl-releasing protein 4 [Carettochelys insculpta]|uniref:RAS guanyl-releasing protein 4 n=1 Tax=Carettochelys insculpta TaxID=44489 RepID=UPI003EBA2F99
MNRKESKRKSRTECPGPAGPSPGKIRQRQSWRRMTCPTPREINKVMASMALGELTKTCSLQQLVEKCLNSFDLAGSLNCSEYTVNMTLTVHSWVVPSADLARHLLVLYREASGETQAERRIRICNFVRYWITHHPEAFRLDPQLEGALGELWPAVQAEGRGPCCQPAETAHVWSRKLSYQNSPNCNKKRKVSLLFDHLDAAELAEHLSYLEFKAFCRLSYLDYRSYVLHGSVQENLPLERSVALCNSISQWVQVMILNRPTPQQRAEVFTKFIRVAQKLRQLQNFNTLMAVLGGLCHSAISRLKDTHALLLPEVTKTLAEMTELLSSCCNYGAYRRAYSECTGFKIPIVGVHLKDLVSLHEALPNRLGDQLNLSKLQSLYQQALELRALQQAVPPFTANKDLVHLLTLSLDLYYTDDELYELSYAREPRCPKALPATPFKPPVMVEWAPGVAPKPDRLTISKHVQQMVESVFKNYDHDQRGYISHEDFEKIVASFPFSFYGLGKDREGPYSREEITAYFMRACAVFAKLGLSFLHDFHEATFKKPTFCHTCNGFLWGVSKQGYRCRDCGMSCHKQCKDLVELECKRRFHTRASEGGTPRARTPAATQHPSSGSEEEAFPFPPAEEQAMVLAGVPTCRQRTRDAWMQTEGPSPTAEGLEPQGRAGGCSRGQTLLEQLQELEKERNRLLLENIGLHCRNAQLEVENGRLLVGEAKGCQATAEEGGHGQASLTLLLEGVDSLHLQRDSKA